MVRSIITMHSLIANAAVLLAITLPFLEIGTHAGRRIDEETNYYFSQEIYKAFQISKRLWLHTQNFERDKTSGRKCTYFEIEDVNENGMRGQMHYHGKFYKTPPVNIEERNKTNALNVSMTSGYACMVLVKDPPVSPTMPENCWLVYRNACNKSGISEQIYENGCKSSAVFEESS
uniref:Putative lipocalin-2 1 n=1 Tax=Amblyomma americanum TaxID=6943 RepID=A0A0C9SFA1_AMBAM